MQFWKMHGAGNDFVVVDARNARRNWSKMAVAMCDRHFGIGADGLLLVLPSKVADAQMRMFNPDGSESEMCGNGIRCFAKYVLENGLTKRRQDELKVQTLAGVLSVWPKFRGKVIVGARVSMGVPRFKPSEIPINLKQRGLTGVSHYPLAVDGREFKVTCLSMGNPHAVAFVEESVEAFALAEVGPKIENHALFPQRVNFEVARVLDKRRIEARVWERGAGETLACGTGACAIAVAAHLHNYIDDKVDIELPGGTLLLEWDGKGEVFLSGPVELVFAGEWRK
ncbi:MAG: diaminopimelate epimerase [Chloroflexi bacterium]|nr:diaminopimelate epimerase [Chloroflexota bacterium]